MFAPSLRALLLFFAFVLPLSVTVELEAQSTGSIRGTVADNTGASIPGATVTVTSTATGQTRTQESNESGLFVFPELAIGSYTVVISRQGFQTQKRPATELLTGQTIDLEVALGLGSQTETVEVRGDT